MGVQVYRPCACAARAAASCQGALEGREERGLARLCEHGKGIAGRPRWVGRVESIRIELGVRKWPRTQGAPVASAGGVLPHSVRRKLQEQRRAPYRGTGRYTIARAYRMPFRGGKRSRP